MNGHLVRAVAFARGRREPSRSLGLIDAAFDRDRALATLAGAVLALLTYQLQGAGVAIFILAVTIAAVSGGLWAGVVAAVLASIALPIVEYPDRVLRFDQLRDLIAAVVFLAIAVVVGLVVGNAADERDRASRREREARLLAFLSAKLLSGDVPDRVLDEFVQVLLSRSGSRPVRCPSRSTARTSRRRRSVRAFLAEGRPR